MSFKCGKVVFLGEMNVGKSSLINAMVGESLSIVSDMPGTTRGEIRGYVTRDDYQIIFLDVPGMQKVRNSLDKVMTKSISHAVAAADVICYVLDSTNVQPEHLKKLKNYENSGKPLLVVLNKTDKRMQVVPYAIPVSAKTGKNLDVLEREIANVLPVAPKMFDADEFTNQPIKEMTREIIRGELIKNLDRDVPHGVAVDIKKWEECDERIEINAEIFCIKPSHKPIIIGKRGEVLKRVGVQSRKQIQSLTDKHVRLYTHVIVREDWKNSKEKLEQLGYTLD